MNILVSRFNDKLNKFVVKTRDPSAFAVDVLMVSWICFKLVYASPPMKILHRMLLKIEQERVPVTILISNWPKRTWYTDEPWSLPSRPVSVFYGMTDESSKR